jgi:hypothetical protein
MKGGYAAPLDALPFFAVQKAAMGMKNLLSAVLSPQGWYCVVALKKTGMPKQVFVQTLEEVESTAQDLLSKHYDVYFACAKYETNSTRTADNVKVIQAFWLDIDCGPGKPYETQTDGLVALKDFCNELGLPKPTLVNSGRGLHVYWAIDKELTKQEWKPIADQLKKVCHAKGLEADPARTADAASILRIPDTKNFKADPALDVTLMAVGNTVSLEVFKNSIGVNPLAETVDYGPTELNELTKSLMGNKQNRFAVLWAKIESGNGCAQIEKAVKEQATLEEPLWRAALSIAAFCSDRDTAIHEVSKDHDEYSPQATEEKASKIKGPYTCEVIEKLNPGGCDECPHKGKLVSPITLGNEVLEAETNEIEFKAEDVSKPVTYTVPEYPFPYFRGRAGGVYRRPSDDEGDPELIYEHDLYVVKRMKDPHHGETIWMRLHTPRDGVKEFALAAVDLLTADKLRDRLAWYGVVGGKKQMEGIMSYIIRFVKDLQCKEGAEVMRTQFGWTEKNGSFVIGDVEICPDGDRYSPPSSNTVVLSPHFEPVGSLEEWKSVVNTYNQAGFEPHAFGFFTAFGAPLLKHLNMKGAIINLINNISGTGKTTTLKAMHSVFGHPEELMLIERDTMNTRLHRLGVMNNIGLGCDEITKMKPDEASDFAYAVSQGRGRGRMKATENAERLNHTKWQTILLCSSNASLVDKFKSLKGTPDGELMRIIEYSIPETKILSKIEADDIYPKLYTNYGHAGRIYIRDLVCNLEERIAEVKEVQKVIDKKIGFTSRERFWSAIAACNIAGALFARRLGLIDIDVGRVFKWMLTEFSQMRDEIPAPASDFASVIGDYWNKHRQNTLVINGEVDKRTGVEMLPILEPRGELTIRMEPDTMKLFIVAKDFRKYCSENQITLKDVLNGLTADGIYGGVKKKRMSKGTKLSTVPPVDAYVFDCSRGDFIDPDLYIEAAKVEEAAEAEEVIDEGESA